MGCDWAELSLQEAGVHLIDCDHRTPPASTDGFPYIAIPQLKDGRIKLEGVRRISTADFEDWTRKLRPRAHDVIVVRRCNSGESAVMPPGLDCAIGQNLVVLRSTDASRVAPTYLRWLVRGPAWWAEVSTYLNVGAVFDSLKCRDIPMFRLPIPPIAEQESIAAFLDALDDRIDNLRATNATLEAIAQALFKSWFVDFDPVHAKAEGRAPEGVDAATAALFPSEFEDSELGPVPKGWRSTRLANLCTKIQNGGTPSRRDSSFWDGGEIPWFKTGELFDGFLIDSSERVTAAALHRTAVKVLPKHAVLMAIYAAPTVGRLGILSQESAFNQACTGMVARDDVGPWFLFQALKNGRSWFNNRANGAAQQNISKAIVEHLPCIEPPKPVLAAFAAIVDPIYERIEESTICAASLSALRDTLLPRLISGKLRLPDAIEAVKDAAA